MPFLQIRKTAFARILDAVRNTILEWSLKMEADGIHGEGLTFTSGRKAQHGSMKAHCGQPLISFKFKI